MLPREVSGVTISFIQTTELISHSAEMVSMKKESALAVSTDLLQQLLEQVQMGGYMDDDIMQQCAAILDRWGPGGCMDVDKGNPKE